MEVTALCIRLMMAVLLLLVAQVHFVYSQKADLDFPRVVPHNQQHFAHESIVVSCEGLEGLTGWRVMREIRGDTKTCAATWSTSTGPCRIETAYPEMDNGKYWCEMGGTEKSNTVNITVTAGPVILESPVLPVTEGEAVTLSCRQKQTSSNFRADFYKDGYLMERSSTGNFTINNVSTSNEGLYKCNIGAEESPESWLIVISPAGEKEPHDDPQLYLPICIGVCVFLFVLLLLVVSLRCRKRQIISTDAPTDAPTSSSTHLATPSPQIEFDEAGEDVPFQPTYAAVTITKHREEKDNDEASFMPVYHTLSLENV